MGLHGEMRLQLASGEVKIADLADQTVLNPDFSEVAFIWDGTRLFVSEVGQVRLLGTEQLFEIELDDGGIVQASASSRFVMKNGDLKIAPELSPGDSLLPLYLESDSYGYPTYRIPGRAVKRKISRLIAEWKHGAPLPRGTDVRHIDGNRKNYHPDNLEITLNKRSKKRSQKNSLTKAYKAAQELLDECAAASPMMAEIVRKKKRTNHKVVRVTPGSLGDVYTASVRSEGSLSVSGVFLELPS